MWKHPLTECVFMAMATCAVAGTRPMAKDDPNLDPGWDWTRKETYTLYSSVSGKKVEKHTTFLPFFSSQQVATRAQVTDLVLVSQEPSPGRSQRLEWQQV